MLQSARLFLLASLMVALTGMSTSAAAHPPAARPGVGNQAATPGPRADANDVDGVNGVEAGTFVALVAGGFGTNTSLQGPSMFGEFGVFVLPRLMFELTATSVLSGANLLGMGLEVHLFGSGRQPRHGFTVAANYMTNASTLFSHSSGVGESSGLRSFETEWAGTLLAGWRFLADSGFFLRLQGGIGVSARGGVTRDVQPVVLRLALGWAL